MKTSQVAYRSSHGGAAVRFLMALALILASWLTLSASTDTVGNVRVQILSPTLVRVEAKGASGFEDRPTFRVVERNWQGESRTRGSQDGFVELATSRFKVRVPQNATDVNGVTITKLDGTQMWTPANLNSVPTRILCRWRDNGSFYLYDKGGVVGYGTDAQGNEYYWDIVASGDRVRIKNRKTGNYMHIENLTGEVECGGIQDYWESARWELKTVDSYVRICNNWKPTRYIHIESLTGNAQCDTILDKWHSAQWSLVDIPTLTEAGRAWIPHPRSKPQVFAIKDSPRIVPASWGYNVAPANAQHPETNGWDLANGADDYYVFLPDGDGLALREEFLRLTGRSELLPLYALGSWNSKWYAYTEATALGQIDRYRQEGIPLDVLVIDTDWRVGASSGYGVNTSLFPDMARFIREAHARNVRIPFNDHPEPQDAMCLGAKEVPFRNDGLRGKLDIGLDFWWFDRNWHTCIIPPPGINKEVFGMYIYEWIARDHSPDKRPFIMANVDGIDNGWLNRAPDIAAHRYTHQWTGDIGPEFASLRREVVNAVHLGVFGPYPYVSADLGGHTANPTVEQFCRWIEFGALSPFFRPHCTKNQSRDPWDWAEPVPSLIKTYLQMRMRMLPVFYTASRLNYDTGEPILRRCDLDYPEYPEAAAEDQYLLGKGILVAPIVEAGTTRNVWLPPGTWIDAWDGQIKKGGSTIPVNRAIGKIPLFIKSGTIVPLAPQMQYTSERPWDTITLDIYPASNGSFTASLYEDDGIGVGYKSGEYRTTAFEAVTDSIKRTVSVAIKAADGEFEGALTQRAWVIRLHRLPQTDSLPSFVAVDGTAGTLQTLQMASNALPFGASAGAPDGDVVQVVVPSGSVTEARTVVFGFDASVETRSAATLSPQATVAFVAGNAMQIRFGHSPDAKVGFELTVCNCKGQTILRTRQSTSAPAVRLPIAGSNGRGLSTGLYMYSLTVTAAGQPAQKLKGTLTIMR